MDLNEPRQDGQPRGRGGKKPKLTPEVHDQIVMLIKVGNYASTAAQAVGINEATFWHWMQYGENPRAPLRYRQFRHAVLNARQIAQANLVTLVRSAADHDWKAAAWMLERIAPSRWGPRVEIDGEVTPRQDGDINLEVFSDEELESWHRLLGKLQAERALVD